MCVWDLFWHKQYKNGDEDSHVQKHWWSKISIKHYFCPQESYFLVSCLKTICSALLLEKYRRLAAPVTVSVRDEITGTFLQYLWYNGEITLDVHCSIMSFYLAMRLGWLWNMPLEIQLQSSLMFLSLSCSSHCQHVQLTVITSSYSCLSPFFGWFFLNISPSIMFFASTPYAADMPLSYVLFLQHIFLHNCSTSTDPCKECDMQCV